MARIPRKAKADFAFAVDAERMAIIGGFYGSCNSETLLNADEDSELGTEPKNGRRLIGGHEFGWAVRRRSLQLGRSYTTIAIAGRNAPGASRWHAPA